MNIYLFLIYSYFLLFIPISISSLSLTKLMLYAFILFLYTLSFSISLIKPYLFITFHYLSIAFPKVWSDIPPLLFLVISHHFLVSIIFYCLLYPTVIWPCQILRAVLIFSLIDTIFVLYSLSIVVLLGVYCHMTLNSHMTQHKWESISTYVI